MAPVLSPASVLIALLLLAAGAVLCATPARPYRTLGQAGLALGAALTTGRYLGAGAGLAVGAVGLLLAWLLDGVEPPIEDPLGVPMRLLLAAFAGVAAAALVAARPLGAAGAVDANVAWYWSGGLGLLLLLSERGPVAAARGGALLVGAAGLAAAHLLPGPPSLLLVAAAALALGLGAAGRWLGAGAPLPSGRTALAVDVVLAVALVAALLGLAGGLPVGPGAPPRLDAGRLAAPLVASLLGLAIALHARLAGLPRPTGVAWAALGAGLVALAALAAPEPGAAGAIAAGAPLLALLGCANRRVDDAPVGTAVPVEPPAEATRPRAVEMDGAAAPILVAAAGSVSAVALALVASAYAVEPQPGLARVGLALALVHAGLLGVLPPWHLWALGLARRAPAAGLAVASAVGGLAGLALLGRAVETQPWLLGVVGTRPLVLGVGLVGVFVGGLTALAEERLVRLSLQLAAVAAGIALIALASDPTAWGEAVGPALVDRAFALGLALLGADAVARWPAGRATSPSARLLRPATLPLWVGLAGLAGLPPTVGFAARWLELGAVASGRADTLGPLVLALLGAVLGLLALKRAGGALMAEPVDRPESGAPPATWRLAAPLLLAALYLLAPLYPAAPLAAAAAMPSP
jgi:hypothetical protein